MKRYKIETLCENRHGVLVRMVQALRQMGLKTTSHQIDAAPEGRKVTLFAEGLLDPEAKPRERLEAIDGVLRLVAVKMAARDRTPGAAKDEAVVEELIARWPNIGPTVDRYKQTIGEAKRPERLSAMGERLGLRAGAQRSAPDRFVSVREALVAHVIPSLNGVADAELQGDAIRVLRSIFTLDTEKPKKRKLAFGFSMQDAFESRVERCDFLAGFIRGVVRASTRRSNLEVVERYCRNEGQPTCRFELEER